MRIFSSAENCRRVARRISLTTCSAGFFTGPDFCPIFAPSMVTMGQKSTLPQPALSVSQVLMPDKFAVTGDEGTDRATRWQFLDQVYAERRHHGTHLISR